MASTFPVKILAVTSKQAASEDAAYAELDKIVDDNPLSEIVTVEDGGYLPDMTKAVRMTNAIYRVNVPGYFFHHIKDPRESGKKSSGILVSCYPSLIDSYVGLVQKEHYCVSLGGTGSPASNRSVKDLDREMIARGWNKESNVIVRDRAGTKIKEASDMVAAIVNQRYGETTYNAYRSTYAVNTGVNNSGGVANNMIPIVPGAGPTNKIAGVSGILDTFKVLTGRKQTPTGGTTSGSYTSDDGSKHSYKGAILVTLSNVYETAYFEGRGTFVYWFHGAEYTGDAATEEYDEYLFVPCAGVRAGCKPLTKIRDCYRRFNTSIPTDTELGLDIVMWHQCHDAFDDHSDLNWVVLKSLAEGLGNPADASITKNTNRPNCHTDAKFLYLNWTSGKYRRLTGRQDKHTFTHAFYGQSLKPQTSKFIVQRPYKLPPVASTLWPAAKVYPSGSPVPTGSVNTWGANSDWTKMVTQYLRDYTRFDPTVDDETKGHSVTAKYDVQKGLAYD